MTTGSIEVTASGDTKGNTALHAEAPAFQQRHVGPTAHNIRYMLDALGETALDDFIARVVPDTIIDRAPLDLAPPLSEPEALKMLGEYAALNKRVKSCIGQGYYGCHTPSVIQRNVFENPGWYTAYTPYQPEVAQGRLEVLFNFQTMITELTGLPIANASLLDEATAAAEAMTMAHRAKRGKKNTLMVSRGCHPQTRDVLETRAAPLGIRILDYDADTVDANACGDDCFALLAQYPATDGSIEPLAQASAACQQSDALLIVATDLLALALLRPPAEFSADIVVGSAQRFGVPMGFGGPHAAFMATTDKLKRSLPGRLVGQSVDVHGRAAYRLALQTREQHIRREKATSNICTAQALLAIMATLYACYHGPAGLRAIARQTHALATTLRSLLELGGFTCNSNPLFDTVAVSNVDSDQVRKALLQAGYNLRVLDASTVICALDETTTVEDVAAIASAFDGLSGNTISKQVDDIARFVSDRLAHFNGDHVAELVDASHLRTDDYMSQPCFHSYRSETEMMRYLRRLADRDIALDRSMIPLGSCTMKLNSAVEMAPVSWPGFTDIHPFAPADQSQGYRQLISDVESMLCACTGYAAVSLQPNAGSQGEYAGLLAISRYHASRGDTDRNICLIPESAHGTNPASAQMAGMQVVVVACDPEGNIDLQDLDDKLAANAGRVAAIMITYPSTHGVFEASVTDVCGRVHDAGGQVYIDGANLNALVGLAQPGKFGGDVSHLNLHKTFCIPHGGGGPGVGPVAVAEHLAPFLPGHAQTGDADGVVSAAPWGSAMILPITWMYIRMMGATGLRHATEVAILSANYIARRLSSAYPILYRGANGYVAHECIVDTRDLKDQAGISVDDIAKRLMDFGFHAPTMSFPVAGTLMIEPTESESLDEIERFCDAMLQIYCEIEQVQNEKLPATDNPLVNAPHTARHVMSTEWTHAYSREQAAFPNGVDYDGKYWPPVGRIDNVHGDKNLICSCPPLSAYQSDSEEVQATQATVKS